MRRVLPVGIRSPGRHFVSQPTTRRSLRGGFGNWIAAAEVGIDKEMEPTTGSFAWTAEDVLTIKSCAYETPFVTTYTLRFEGNDRMTLRRR